MTIDGRVSEPFTPEWAAVCSAWGHGEHPSHRPPPERTMEQWRERSMWHFCPSCRSCMTEHGRRIPGLDREGAVAIACTACGEIFETCAKWGKAPTGGLCRRHGLGTFS